MSEQPNPDERFDQVESTLIHLANSQRHLLTAQVLLNDRMDRAESAIQKIAEQAVRTDQRLDKLAEKIDSLADSVKHTDSNVEALTEIVRQLIERNGGNGQHPS